MRRFRSFLNGTAIVLYYSVRPKERTMKTIGLSFILSVGMLVSGCYTQLALNNDETETAVVVQPSPVVVIVEPVFVPVVYPYPPPAVGVPAPSPVTQPGNPIRDIGNQRGSSGRDTGSRNTGSSRGGR
jgi:hypothetical protein